MSTATEKLAAHVAQLTFDKLPGKVVQHAKNVILDTVGVILAGSRTPHGNIAVEIAKEFADKKEATVFADGSKTSCLNAAFANALMGGAVGFDDTYEPGMIHPAPPTFAAPFALGERLGASGRDLITALVAGYDVGLRVGDAVLPWHVDQGFHPTGTVNHFCTGAAAGKMLGLDAEQMVHALALVGEQAAGLLQQDIDGSIADSSLDRGKSAFDGILSALMAHKGYKGPRNILEGRYGFCRVLSPEYDGAKLTADLGERYRVSETTIKPFPCCRFTHAGLAAARSLARENNIRAGDIESILIRTNRQAVASTDRAGDELLWNPIMSFQYNISCILVRGDVTLADLKPESVRAPEVFEFSRKVRLVEDEELNKLYPQKWPSRVEITLKDGRTFSRRQDDAPGGPVLPMTDEEIARKFRNCAAPIIGDEKVEKLLEAIQHLEDLDDVRRLDVLLSR